MGRRPGSLNKSRVIDIVQGRDAFKNVPVKAFYDSKELDKAFKVKLPKGKYSIAYHHPSDPFGPVVIIATASK